MAQLSIGKDQISPQPPSFFVPLGQIVYEKPITALVSLRKITSKGPVSLSRRF